MMRPTAKLSRRTFLRGGMATVMLPILEANGVSVLNAATPSAASTSGIPKRLVFIAMGYGVDDVNWMPDPTQVGTDFQLPQLLQPFAELKSDFSILQNLTNVYNGDPHAGTANFLTSVNPRSTPGVPYKNAVSCDQVAAEVLGKDTRYTSMALGNSSSGPDGHGGRYGYASWSRNGAPVGLYRSVTQVYGALFGSSGATMDDMQAQLARQQSSLDALTGHAKRLNTKISSADRDRVDEYFTTIREIENRLTKAQQWTDTPFPDAPFADPGEVNGIEGIQLYFDMMHLALQSDSTRVMTYMLPTGPILKHLKSSLNPHRLSHFGVGKDNYETQQQRDLIFSQMVAGFLKKLKETKERDGSSLLDHCLVAYGSNLRRNHQTKNSPMLLAGHGGGGLKQGQNIVYEANKTPMSNLWLSMIRHVGVDQESFADSDRVLTEVGFS